MPEEDPGQKQEHRLQAASYKCQSESKSRSKGKGKSFASRLYSAGGLLGPGPFAPLGPGPFALGPGPFALGPGPYALGPRSYPGRALRAPRVAALTRAQ